jgi:hypothetical protein
MQGGVVLYLEVVLARLEYPGGAEEHGHMRVVPAHGHLPGVPDLVLPLHGLLTKSKQSTQIDASGSCCGHCRNMEASS